MKNRLFLFLLILLLAMLACGLPAGDSSAPETSPDTVSTLVAEQLTEVSVSPVEPVATSAPLVVETPTASPDTLAVVYSKGGNIWLWTASTGPRQLTTSGRDDRPLISDDRQLVAFLRDGELYGINADGSNERILAGKPYLSSFALADTLNVIVRTFKFMPGSHTLFFDLLGETQAYPHFFFDLHRVNADAPGPVQFLPAGQGGGNWSLSPDGQWLALSHRDQISVMHLDGSDAHTVFNFNPISTYSEMTYFPEIVWMNTSSGLYTVIPASAVLENPKETTRYFYLPVSGEPARLAEFIPSPFAWPLLAPDGLKVAYVQGNETSGTIHVIDASTADKTLRDCVRCALKGWSADGQALWFDVDGSTWILMEAGGQVPASDVSSAAHDLRWVDGQLYLFRTAFGDEGELRLARIGQPSTLVDSAVSFYDFVSLP